MSLKRYCIAAVAVWEEYYFCTLLVMCVGFMAFMTVAPFVLFSIIGWWLLHGLPPIH